MSSLKDKVVLITGASSGIGAGTAVHFANLGAKLAISGRNETNLTAVKEKCKATGLSPDKIISIVGDVTIDDDVRRIVSQTIAYFNQLDVLVNSAGNLVAGSVQSTSMEDYDRQMNLNARSVFHMGSLCIPHLIKTKGNIVNVSSVTGMRAFPGVAAYCMSKAALDQYTRCAALDLAEYGVRVNAVNPGVIRTEIHKRAGMDEETYAKFLEKCKSTHALGRHGEVEEVATAIEFLASSSSSYVTGVTIPVDGGRHAMCPR